MCVSSTRTQGRHTLPQGAEHADSQNVAEYKPTVRDILDDSLHTPRVRSLEAACARIAERPLDRTLAELRQVIAEPVTSEASWRLHVLVSTLYHRAGVALDLTIALRGEIETAHAAQPAKE